MIKQISLVAIIAIGIGALFLGTVITPVFAQQVPPSQIPSCTGDPHNGFRNPDTGNPHVGGFGGAATGNPHVGLSGDCPGAK